MYNNKKGVWKLIFSIKLKNYIKILLKFVSLPIIALIIIFAMTMSKYELAYKVTISGEEVGYIASKSQFEKLIESEILNPKEENVAYVNINVEPQYSYTLADIDGTNEDEIFAKIKENSVTTYRLYSIAINGENKAYVNDREGAEEAVASLKQEYEGKLTETEISVQELYTQDLETLSTVEVASAVSSMEEELNVKVQYEEQKKAATLDGVYFATKPVTGNITSRFGAVESIRDHVHQGMDIAAPGGTPILASADGTVTFAGWNGGYGNLIIISHGNGIQTYYGHCSKLYASVGETVSAGEKIAAVGTTGNSTGNHLHFEIRKNGKQINPQIYVYK